MGVVRASGEPTSAPSTPSTAKDAIETGLMVFEKKDYEGALRLFKAGMALSPNEDEARAAMYNMACVYAKNKQFAKASECVKSAVNDHNLRLIVALRDDDLAALRESPEWLSALRDMRGSMSANQKIQLRSEAKAPFRLARTFIFGGLAASAGLALIITIPAVILAVQGKEGTSLATPLTNLAINGAGVALFSFLLFREAQGKEKLVKVIAREEGLAELKVQLTDKQVSMEAMRGVIRPVLLVGNQTYLDRCIRAVEPFYAEMRERGVSLIPVLRTKADDPDDRIRALKKEMQAGKSPSKAGFGERTPGTAPGSGSSKVGAKDAKWKLDPVDKKSWVDWVEGAKAAAGVESDNVYVQVQLDGSIRASGTGIPPWEKFVGDIPELDSIRTSMTDGVGPSV